VKFLGTRREDNACGHDEKAPSNNAHGAPILIFLHSA